MLFFPSLALVEHFATVARKVIMQAHPRTRQRESDTVQGQLRKARELLNFCSSFLASFNKVKCALPCALYVPAVLRHMRDYGIQLCYIQERQTISKMTGQYITGPVQKKTVCASGPA